MNFCKPLTISFLLAVALTSLAGPALEAAPGSISPASGTSPVASETTKTSAKPMSNSSVGATSMPSAVQSDAKSATDKTDYVYKTDGETDELQAAISRYNDRYCPPNELITEISRASVGTLIKYECLKSFPKQLDDLIIRDGKVFRRTKRDAPPPVERGDAPGSLLGAFGVTVKSVDQQSPKSEGNKVVENLNLIEKKVMVKQTTGNYEEITYTVPQVPPRVKAPPKKSAVRTRSDAVRRQILQSRYRTTIPLTPTETAQPVTGK